MPSGFPGVQLNHEYRNIRIISAGVFLRRIKPYYGCSLAEQDSGSKVGSKTLCKLGR